MLRESETLIVCFLFHSNGTILTLFPQIIADRSWCVWLSETIQLHGCQISKLWPHALAVNSCTCLGPFYWPYWPFIRCQVWHSKQTLLCSDTGLLAGDQIPLNAVVVTLTPCSLIRPSCQSWVWTCIMSLLLQHVNLPDILYYVMALKKGPVIYWGKLTWYSAWCHATLPGRLPVCCYFIATQLCHFRAFVQQSHFRELLVGNLVALPLKCTVTTCVQFLLYDAVTILHDYSSYLYDVLKYLPHFWQTVFSLNKSA